MIVPEEIQNPADMSDPQAQQKMAAGILSQLGLHPDQQGARNLLDMHFQGPTANPEISQALGSAVKPPEQKQPLINAIQPEVTSNPVQVEKPVSTTQSGTPSPLINPGVPTMPSPSMANRISTNTDADTLSHQDELNRLIRTGPGESQIKNPFLRGLAKVGDTAAKMFAPSYEPLIPGSEGHHQALMNKQEGLIKTDLGNSDTEAKIAQTKQATKNASTEPERNPNELATWMKQNPGEPIETYWKAKATSDMSKKTAAEQLIHYFTTPVESGGMGLSMADAYDKMKKMDAENKPATTASSQLEIQGLIAKAMPNGQMDPKAMTDPDALISMISKSQLTPEERSKVFADLLTKTSPAGQGGVARIRVLGQELSRLTPAMNNQGQLGLVNPQQVNGSPFGTYVPATAGTQALTKEAGFAELNRIVDLTHDSLTGLKTPFSAEQRAKMALALRSPNPASAWDAFFHSSVGEALTPDQADYATALASLNENAMALRSIQGMGQGSDQLRGAIHAMLPGAGTPNPQYAERQLNIIKAMMQTLKGGVAKTGIKQPEVPRIPNTGTGNSQPPQGKTFTKAQVQAVADQNKISYEDAKADALKQGHKVVE